MMYKRSKEMRAIISAIIISETLYLKSYIKLNINSDRCSLIQCVLTQRDKTTRDKSYLLQVHQSFYLNNHNLDERQDISLVQISHNHSLNIILADTVSRHTAVSYSVQREKMLSLEFCQITLLISQHETKIHSFLVSKCMLLVLLNPSMHIFDLII